MDNSPIETLRRRAAAGDTYAIVLVQLSDQANKLQSDMILLKSKLDFVAGKVEAGLDAIGLQAKQIETMRGETHDKDQ